MKVPNVCKKFQNEKFQYLTVLVVFSDWPNPSPKNVLEIKSNGGSGIPGVCIPRMQVP